MKASLRPQEWVFFHTASNGQSSFHRHAEPYFELDCESNEITAYLLADCKTTLFPLNHKRTYKIIVRIQAHYRKCMCVSQSQSVIFASLRGRQNQCFEVTIAKGSIGNRSYTATWTVGTKIRTTAIDSKKVNVYDLNGHILRRSIPISMLNKELPRGIYIIDGKKVVITK